MATSFPDPFPEKPFEWHAWDWFSDANNVGWRIRLHPEWGEHDWSYEHIATGMRIRVVQMPLESRVALIERKLAVLEAAQATQGD